MPHFLVELLSASAETATPFIRGLVELPEKLSANEILRRIKAGGLKIRRKTGLALIRKYQERVGNRKYFKSVNYDKLLDWTRISYATDKLLRPFSFEIKVAGISKVTGEKVEKFFTTSTSKKLTKAQAVQALLDKMHFGEGSQALLNQTNEVTDILIAPGTIV